MVADLCVNYSNSYSIMTSSWPCMGVWQVFLTPLHMSREMKWKVTAMRGLVNIIYYCIATQMEKRKPGLAIEPGTHSNSNLLYFTVYIVGNWSSFERMREREKEMIMNRNIKYLRTIFISFHILQMIRKVRRTNKKVLLQTLDKHLYT